MSALPELLANNANGNKWCAFIYARHSKNVNLGRYRTEIDAARAFDRAARVLGWVPQGSVG